jgi:hypothetical protein
MTGKHPPGGDLQHASMRNSCFFATNSDTLRTDTAALIVLIRKDATVKFSSEINTNYFPKGTNHKAQIGRWPILPKGVSALRIICQIFVAINVEKFQLSRSGFSTYSHQLYYQENHPNHKVNI